MAFHNPGLAAVFANFREPLVLALGITQTIGYGTLYYAYGVLAEPIARELGISLDVFFGIFTVGLLLGGLVAPMVGRVLDQRGARPVMATGSAVAALALFLCALAPNIWLFGGAVILMEIAACMVLYEAAFAALTQSHGHAARPRITAITLIAGFASTIFWPLTQWLSQTFDWRVTWLLFAAAQALVCLPLHILVLGKAKTAAKSGESASGTTGDQPVLVGAKRSRAIWFYAIAICVSGIIYSAIPLHMLGIIRQGGFDAQSAALIAMLMGPAQVMARVLEVVGGHRFDAITTGRVALTALPVALAALLLAPIWSGTVYLFAVLYGVSQGLISIARGTVPLQLFGPVGYATLVGRITGFRFILNAGAPFAFAVVATRLGTNWALLFCLVFAAAACITFLALPRPKARDR